MDSPMPTPTLGTLGTLTLVGRKDNRDVQSFPIDSERVTIGRDYECDIRLYFSDVSKLHCEIVFDLLTDKAALHIHGANGAYVIPKDGEKTFCQPSTVLPLSDGDKIIVRKKIFRFEYGSAVSPFETPTKSPATPPQAHRRSSHRLSLVPAGKTFTPYTPLKGQPHEEEILEPGKEEELVNVAEGDEGDKVYVEVKQNFPLSSTPSVRPRAQVAFGTPLGPASLRKNLLLKSARKTWQDTQSPGLEGAIEKGDVQVRRRSKGSPSRYQLPVGHQPEEEEADLFENNDRDVVKSEGVEQAAADDLPSGRDDLSDEVDEVWEQAEADEVEEAEAVEGFEVQELDDDDTLNAKGLASDSPALPGTPAAARALSRFYTPQPRRNGAMSKSSILGTIGPAVRFKPIPATPDFDKHMVHAVPRSGMALGPPSRSRKPIATTPRSGGAATPHRHHIATLEEENNDADGGEGGPEESAATSPLLKYGTPQKQAMREEAKRRRQSLATPRALPAPPTGGFRSSMFTPRPSAVAPRGSGAAAIQADIATPLKDIRRRLEAVRSQSGAALRTGRRMTVGLGGPATPARSSVEESKSFTVAVTRTTYTLNVSTSPVSRPSFVPIGEVESNEQTPIRSAGSRVMTPVALDDVLSPSTPTFAGPANVSEVDIGSSTPTHLGRSAPTPSYAGIRTMMQQPRYPQTPNFAGMREMLAERAAPPTPSFVGVKDMYRPAKELGEPELHGVAEMFETPDTSDEGIVLGEDGPTEGEESTRAVGDKSERPSRSARKAQGLTARDVDARGSSPVKPSEELSDSPIKTRQARTTTTSTTTSTTAPTRLRRVAKADHQGTVQSKSTSSRSTRKATEEAAETDDVLGETVTVSEEPLGPTAKPAKRKAAPKAAAEPTPAPSRSRTKKAKEEKENEPEEPAATKAPRRAAAKKAAEALAERSVSSRTTRSRK